MGGESLHLWGLFSLLLGLSVPAFGLNLDGTLLLALRYSVVSDPLSVLGNWNYNDSTPCSWTGVTCGEIETGTMDSSRVVSLALPNSKLAGTIPEYLGFIQHLRAFDLSTNFFNGTLPASLSNASELELLSLSNNALSGGLPELPKGLKLLNLSDNAFGGGIPESLTSLPNLTVVSLKNNYVSGAVPSGVRSVEFMDLSSNFLNGSLPSGFGGMNLRHLNLSSNRISGRIPEEFASEIPSNVTIDLSFNNLVGEIPESSLWSNQEAASYAGNADLCGKQLKKLCAAPSALSTQPNTSSAAIAAMPRTVSGDSSTETPGSAQNEAQSPPQHRLNPGAVAGIAVGDLAGIGVLAMLLLYVYQRRKKANSETKDNPISTTANAYEFTKDPESEATKESRNRTIWPCLSITIGEETSEATSSETDDNNAIHLADHHLENQQHLHELMKNERSLVMIDGETELDLETLLKASAYLLGSTTGSSKVYRAVIQDGTTFAVRRIGESGVKRYKEFESQIRSIARLRHPNIIRVRGFYWGDDEKLLLYDYAINGSLANVHYRKTGSSPYNLSFEARLNIAKGIARGLACIHEKKHVHGNIKASNILLTEDMQPIISDFGLHWLIYGKQSRKTDRHGLARHFGSMRSRPSHHDSHYHAVEAGPYIAGGFVGCTSPYHAPESLKSLKPSPKWDVYSFGILLLELLTGKVFLNRELSQWTAGSVAEDPAGVLRMTDAALRGDVSGREDALLAWFELGFHCASLIPHKRPSMKDALHVLDQIPC